jgi:hypothetical protein
MSKLKTPQGKKVASYDHDRRNAYGENAKSSRKNIPRAKVRVRRAERRVVRQALDAAIAPEKAEAAVSDTRLQRREGFKKTPDIPLREMVTYKLEKRDRRGGRRENK